MTGNGYLHTATLMAVPEGYIHSFLQIQLTAAAYNKVSDIAFPVSSLRAALMHYYNL